VVEVVTAVGPELAQLAVAGPWVSTFVRTKTAFNEMAPLAFLRPVCLDDGTRVPRAVGVAAEGGAPDVRVDSRRFTLAGVRRSTLY